jgi:hypothetical protein
MIIVGLMVLLFGFGLNLAYDASIHKIPMASKFDQYRSYLISILVAVIFLVLPGIPFLCAI